MKITVDQLEKGMLVEVTYKLKEASAPRTNYGLVTDVIKHIGQSGRGGMDQGSPTYVEYQITFVDVTDRDGIQTRPEKFKPNLFIEGKGSWSSSPFDVLELTFLRMHEPIIMWQNSHLKTTKFLNDIKNKQLDEITKKVKSVLTDDELEVLISLRGK